MLLNKSLAGCLPNLALVGLLFLCAPLVVQAVKRCDVMVASGAWRSEINGYYDVTDQRCYGRDVYLKRGSTDSNKIYLYYYRKNLVKRGWTIAKEPCYRNDDRYFHVYNTNRRPDRVLFSWVERDLDGQRRYNRNFDIDCTEGLSFGAILGISFGCIFGAFAIGAGVFFLVKYTRKH